MNFACNTEKFHTNPYNILSSRACAWRFRHHCLKKLALHNAQLMVEYINNCSSSKVIFEDHSTKKLFHLNVESFFFQFEFEEIDADQRLSFDSKPADHVTTNQTWLSWSMKYFLHINQFGLLKGNMTPSGSWLLEGYNQLLGKGGNTSFAFLRRQGL